MGKSSLEYKARLNYQKLDYWIAGLLEKQIPTIQ